MPVGSTPRLLSELFVTGAPASEYAAGGLSKVDRAVRSYGMGRVIVIQFVTLDGVVQDPDGSDGSAFGGWAFKFGPEAVAGDKFKLGPLMNSGALVLGRRTWDHFSTLWPRRTDEFSQRMNRMRKLVASQTLGDVSAWSNSTLLEGDALHAIEHLRALDPAELVVVGSTSLVHRLIERDLVDEFRLIVFPIILGSGTRLFESAGAEHDLRLTSVEQVGAATLHVYARTRAAITSAAG